MVNQLQGFKDTARAFIPVPFPDHIRSRRDGAECLAVLLTLPSKRENLNYPTV
ncbi:hypothetical protein BPY_22510 [Bifidobacterium psychraerophilum]|jgi:hypothetical protein